MMGQSIQRYWKLQMSACTLPQNQKYPNHPLIDTHCHIDFPAFDSDRHNILQQCAVRHINTLVIPGIHANQWPHLLKLLNEQSPIRLLGALGMHPCFKDYHQISHLNNLEALLTKQSDAIIAVGEIGLDFYYGMDDAPQQIQYFTQQLEIAKQMGKPAIIHSRKAHDIVCKQLRLTGFNQGGIIHAFSGSQQQAEAFISLGFHLGIGGGITYPRAKKLRRLASTLPLTSLVLETDAPDMPLNGYQGIRNTPEHLPDILNMLSILRNEPHQTVAQQTYINSYNALQLY